jgi:hypothetical protein
MHKDPIFWRENITNFEEHDFQVYVHYLLHSCDSILFSLLS